MGGIASVHAVVLECPDPRELARFYRDLTGWSIMDEDDPDWNTLKDSGEGGIRIAFQRAPGYQPPVWPDPASPMQFHLDFDVEDLDSAEEQALKLGATKFDHQPSPANFRVYADPAGHPFCLCV
jgi:predicted enzyme related to lactoylglutathione lyase